MKIPAILKKVLKPIIIFIWPLIKNLIYLVIEDILIKQYKKLRNWMAGNYNKDKKEKEDKVSELEIKIENVSSSEERDYLKIEIEKLKKEIDEIKALYEQRTDEFNRMFKETLEEARIRIDKLKVEKIFEITQERIELNKGFQLMLEDVKDNS